MFDAEYQRRERANREARARREPEIYITGTVALGVELARLVGRPNQWNHSAVSRFLTGERCTIEMAEAFSLLFGLPRFQAVVRAETLDDARELELYLRRAQARLTSVDREATSLQHKADRQTGPVSSPAHGAIKGSGGGRTRRTGGRS